LIVFGVYSLDSTLVGAYS